MLSGEREKIRRGKEVKTRKTIQATLDHLVVEFPLFYHVAKVSNIVRLSTEVSNTAYRINCRGKKNLGPCRRGTKIPMPFTAHGIPFTGHNYRKNKVVTYRTVSRHRKTITRYHRQPRNIVDIWEPPSTVSPFFKYSDRGSPGGFRNPRKVPPSDVPKFVQTLGSIARTCFFGLLTIMMLCILKEIHPGLSCICKGWLSLLESDHYPAFLCMYTPVRVFYVFRTSRHHEGAYYSHSLHETTAMLTYWELGQAGV